MSRGVLSRLERPATKSRRVGARAQGGANGGTACPRSAMLQEGGTMTGGPHAWPLPRIRPGNPDTTITGDGIHAHNQIEAAESTYRAEGVPASAGEGRPARRCRSGEEDSPANLRLRASAIPRGALALVEGRSGRPFPTTGRPSCSWPVWVGGLASYQLVSERRRGSAEGPPRHPPVALRDSWNSYVDLHIAMGHPRVRWMATCRARPEPPSRADAALRGLASGVRRSRRDEIAGLLWLDPAHCDGAPRDRPAAAD
jgi:hypothetical protein